MSDAEDAGQHPERNIGAFFLAEMGENFGEKLC